MFDAGSVQLNIVDLQGDLIGAFQTRARRHENDRDEIPNILIRNEAGAHPRHLETGQTDQRKVSNQNNAEHADESAGHLAVARRQPLESVVEATEKRLQETT